MGRLKPERAGVLSHSVKECYVARERESHVCVYVYVCKLTKTKRRLGTDYIIGDQVKFIA